MATRETIELLFKSVFSGKGASDAGSSLDGIKNKATAAAAAYVSIEGAQMAWEAAMQGSLMSQNVERFDALAASIGANAGLLRRLQEATLKQATAQDIMTAASSLMSVGMADNESELQKHFEIVTRLKKPQEDFATALEGWSLMLANQSIPRLDTFGISGATVRERILELQEAEAGLSREQAFLIATTEQAELAIEKLGDAAENASNDYVVLQTRFQDLTNNSKIMLGEGLSPLVTNMADATDQTASWTERIEAQIEAQARLTPLLTTGIQLYERYGVKLLESTGVSGSLRTALENATEWMGLNNDATVESAEIHMQQFAPAIRESASALTIVQQAAANTMRAVDGLTDATVDNIKVNSEQDKGLEKTFDSLQRNREEREETMRRIEAHADVTEARIRQEQRLREEDEKSAEFRKSAIDLLNRARDRSAVATEQQAAEQERVNRALEEAAEKQRDYNEMFSDFFSKAITAKETANPDDMFFRMASRAKLAAGELAVLATGLGVYSEEAALAAFREALLAEEQHRLIASIQARTLSISDAIEQYRVFQSDLADRFFDINGGSLNEITGSGGSSDVTNHNGANVNVNYNDYSGNGTNNAAALTRSYEVAYSP